MKTIIKTVFYLSFLSFFQNANAQFIEKLAKKTEKASERAVERKVEQKATKTTNDAMDDVLNGSKSSKSSKTNNSKTKVSKTETDFISGTKVLFEENFRADATGDFPVNWFTNSSGEIVTMEGNTTKWLQISDKGSFTPLKIAALPENFTFEFDLTTTDNFNNYSSPLNVVFTEKKAKTDNVWNTTLKRKEAMIFNIHPSNSLSGTGRSEVFIISEKKEIMKNKADVPSFSKTNAMVRVQIWRQKNRFRMYVDGKKYWDLPMAFGDINYNQITFFIGTYKNTNDKFFISNLKLAEAGADKRHQLIETGSFSTNEILFDTNKASIQPSSKKILDEIGKVLQENETISITITGHTDNEGGEKENQKLAEKRAENVALYFTNQFGITKSRLETYGKGESEPISENTSEEGKKQNRRVDFKIIK